MWGDTQCTMRPYISDPWMVVEAMAVLTTTILIGQLGLTDAILEGDSLELVQALRREERSWTKYGPILEETKELLHGCHSWEICHVRRTTNEAVHMTAKIDVSLNVSQPWLTMTLPCISDIGMTESVFLN
jgi:hypothetical protein